LNWNYSLCGRCRKLREIRKGRNYLRVRNTRGRRRMRMLPCHGFCRFLLLLGECKNHDWSEMILCQSITWMIVLIGQNQLSLIQVFIQLHYLKQTPNFLMLCCRCKICLSQIIKTRLPWWYILGKNRRSRGNKFIFLYELKWKKKKKGGICTSWKCRRYNFFFSPSITKGVQGFSV